MSDQAVLEKREKEMQVVKDENEIIHVVIRDLKNKREIIIASFKKPNKKNFMEELSMRIFRFFKENTNHFIKTETEPINWHIFPELQNTKPWKN